MNSCHFGKYIKIPSMNSTCCGLVLMFSFMILLSCGNQSKQLPREERIVLDSLHANQLILLGDSLYAQRSNASNFSNALIYYDSARIVAERLENPILKANCYQKLGNVYIAWNKEPNKTIEYYKEALKIFKNYSNKKIKSYYLNYIIAHAYDQEKLNDSLSCINTLKETEKMLSKESQPFIDSLLFLPDYAWVAANIRNYDFAYNFLKKYTKREKIINDPNSNNYLDHYYLTKARIDIFGKKLKNSVYLDSLEIAIKNCNNKSDLYYYLYSISSLFSYLNLRDKEVNALNQILSINKKISENEISILKTQNELEKKLNETIMQKINMQRAVSKAQLGLLLALMALIILLGIWRYRNIKLKKNQLEENAIRQSAFTQKLFEVTELERKRIAVELHDSVSNDLVSLKHFMNNLSEFNIRIEEILEGIRLMSRNLHPTFFEKVGLKYSIKQLLDRIQHHDQFMINFEIDYHECLSKLHELQLYRIIQEAITNMVKYSDAVAGKITIIEYEEELFVEIRDNGKGFDVQEKLSNMNSFGLHNIIERSKAIMGETSITSGKDGTIITIKILKK